MIFIKNIEEYNPNKKCKILTVFNDQIADMLSNKKLNPRVTDLFIRDGKPIAFITQFYFALPKDIRLDSTHYFITKTTNKRQLQPITFNHLSVIDFRDFMNLYKKRTVKPHSFLVIDATLAPDNLLRFRKSLLERI